MPADYIPDSAANRAEWLANFKAQVTSQASALNLPPNRVTELASLLDPLIAAYEAVVAADAALAKASGDAQGLYDENVTGLRAIVNEVKANPAFTDGMGETMRIFTTNGSPPPADIQPRLFAAGERGHVRITGSKNYAETVNIYLRRKGGPWMLIAPKRKRFPFDDQTPLAEANTPEIREYMARGVIGDEEIGKDSDIVAATYGG